MPPTLDDAFAPTAGESEVHGQLHDVHPHAVWEVTVDGTRAVYKLARGPEAVPARSAVAVGGPAGSGRGSPTDARLTNR